MNKKNLIIITMLHCSMLDAGAKKHIYKTRPTANPVLFYNPDMYNALEKQRLQISLNRSQAYLDIVHAHKAKAQLLPFLQQIIEPDLQTFYKKHYQNELTQTFLNIITAIIENQKPSMISKPHQITLQFIEFLERHAHFIFQHCIFSGIHYLKQHFYPHNNNPEQLKPLAVDASVTAAAAIFANHINSIIHKMPVPNDMKKTVVNYFKKWNIINHINSKLQKEQKPLLVLDSPFAYFITHLKERTADLVHIPVNAPLPTPLPPSSTEPSSKRQRIS